MMTIQPTGAMPVDFAIESIDFGLQVTVNGQLTCGLFSVPLLQPIKMPFILIVRSSRATNGVEVERHVDPRLSWPFSVAVSTKYGSITTALSDPMHVSLPPTVEKPLTSTNVALVKRVNRRTVVPFLESDDTGYYRVNALHDGTVNEGGAAAVDCGLNFCLPPGTSAELMPSHNFALQGLMTSAGVVPVGQGGENESQFFVYNASERGIRYESGEAIANLVIHNTERPFLYESYDFEADIEEAHYRRDYWHG